MEQVNSPITGLGVGHMNTNRAGLPRSVLGLFVYRSCRLFLVDST